MTKPPVYVVGVGMTKFVEPGSEEYSDYPQMAVESVTKALLDAKIGIQKVDQACVGYVYGDSLYGQRVLYEIGMTGVPIYNVNNSSSTGSSALYLGKQLIESKNANCVLVLGFDNMELLPSSYTNRPHPLEKHLAFLKSNGGCSNTSLVAQLYGFAALEYMLKYNVKPETFAKIAHKNHKHSVNNPYSQCQKNYSLNDVLQSPKLVGPITELQCYQPADGSAAVILASHEFVVQNNLQNQAITVIGMEMATDPPTTFSGQTFMQIIGYDMTKLAAEKLFTKTNFKPHDVDVAELHDCFSVNELITYEALGFCEPGKAEEFVESGSNTYGGKVVVNPSGGLIAKGHPSGATGLAQCCELYWQLLGKADKRQVLGAKVALQHNIGMGAAAVVALYERAIFTSNSQNQYSSDLKTDMNPTTFMSHNIFQTLKNVMLTDKDNHIEKFRGIYCFKITNNDNKEGMWIVDAKNGTGNVTFYGKDKADVTITLQDDDVVELVSGKLDLISAFLLKKIKIQGNLKLGLQLVHLQKLISCKNSKLKSKL